MDALGLNYRNLHRSLGEIAVAAGLPVLEIYERGATVTIKSNASPVTEADLAAEELILRHLCEAFPGVPVLAEEQVASGVLPECGDTFIAVDPLDGTKEFIAGSDEFTVNIAFIANGIPVAGAIYAPALKRLWIGGEQAETMTIAPGRKLDDASEQRTIHVRSSPREGLTAVVSKSHLDAKTEDFLARIPISSRRDAGSSLKFCLVAEGQADVYPRFGPTMEWDTAAGHAILLAAGGRVLTESGKNLSYGKRSQEYRNGPFIGWGGLRA